MDDKVGRFEELAKLWKQHCEDMWGSSRIDNYLNHPAYGEIVQMGRPAIPLIMKRYEAATSKDFSEAPWGFVLDEITGLNMIGDRQRYDPAIVKEKYIEWWHDELKKQSAITPDPSGTGSQFRGPQFAIPGNSAIPGTHN